MYESNKSMRNRNFENSWLFRSKWCKQWVRVHVFVWLKIKFVLQILNLKFAILFCEGNVCNSWLLLQSTNIEIASAAPLQLERSWRNMIRFITPSKDKLSSHNSKETPHRYKRIFSVFQECSLAITDGKPSLSCELFDLIKLHIHLACFICLVKFRCRWERVWGTKVS